jgi:hypothetical protein
MDNPNVTPTTPTALSDASDFELEDATAAIVGGDSAAGRWALDIKKALASVNSASRGALAEAARLHADDVSNPAGVARRLSEIPANLRASTEIALEQAALDLDIIEGAHLAALIKHDPRDDAALRWELDNHLAGVKPDSAAATLVGLAADPRYATFLSGPAGKSLAARYGLKDSEMFRKVALQALAANGTEDQRRRSAALAAIPAARRALTLARAGRDHVAQESQRAPVRPSGAGLMG